MQVRVVTILKTLQIILVVILPLIGIVVLNLKIILVLRRSSVLVTRSTKSSTDDPNDEFLRLVRSLYGGRALDADNIRSSIAPFFRDTDSRQKRDRKVTITVLAIIACFFLTHVLDEHF